jgi:hypothetical protein
MKWLTIPFIKRNSRIDNDCEDSLLELYGDSAEESIAALLNRGKTVDECYDSLMEEYGDIPAKIIHASLMLADLAYTHRSPVSPTNMSIVPYTFDLLVKPYMRLADKIE